MLDFREHVIMEQYSDKSPEECLRHAIRLLQHRRDQQAIYKSISILSLFALQNSTSGSKEKNAIRELLARLAGKSGAA